jgi:signal transduction histidine kinase
VRSATSERCPIQLEADAKLPPRQLDPGLLQHILTNLLTNAVKYSPAGSEVALRIEAQDGALVFTVTDHGPGIAEEDVPHLFEPFHRGKNAGQISGSGLGLAIVQRCVQAHGGTIHLESNKDDGTRAIVRIPSAPFPNPKSKI